jgi:DNA-binding protein H-NS
MKNNLNDMSEAELANVIENARKALKDKQDSKRKEELSKIKELATSIGVNVEISESGSGSKPSSRKGSSVPIKYRDPANSANKWTGRGMKPKWLRELLNQGRTLKEFEI